MTFAQFDEFCSAAGYAKPDDNAWGRGNRPVINVNVVDAKAFCQWLSKETGKSIRLPEESEWEFAAKGGKKSNGYIFSGSNKLDTVGWYSGNSDFKTHEVWYQEAKRTRHLRYERQRVGVVRKLRRHSRRLLARQR